MIWVFLGIGILIGFAAGICLAGILSINRENDMIVKLEQMKRLLEPCPN